LEALESGRVRYVPSHSGRLTEVEGPATLAVEVISDSSVGKDRKRLPPLYARAGVEELWIADARGRELAFEIYHLGQGAYTPALPDAQGFQLSLVLGRRIRLRREPWRFPGTWCYFVDESQDAPTA
ncbi:MAG: Uma2 family endonuclease, partial [Armatimonadetes bacterium]|nr:Uma2 family endonuclease [Armatimonadota bacterium]